MCTCLCTCVCTCVCACTCTCVCVCVRVRVRVRVRTCTCAYVYVCVCVCVIRLAYSCIGRGEWKIIQLFHYNQGRWEYPSHPHSTIPAILLPIPLLLPQLMFSWQQPMKFYFDIFNKLLEIQLSPVVWVLISLFLIMLGDGIIDTPITRSLINAEL